MGWLSVIVRLCRQGGWRSVFLLTLLTLLVCYSVALQRGNSLPIAVDYLFGEETAAGERYQWTPSQLHLFVPLELTAPALIVTQRSSAGPDVRATRMLTITSAGVATSFELVGGLPARYYSYLLPIDGHTLTADYVLKPLAQPVSGEERDLGFILYTAPALSVRSINQSNWPALPLLVIASIVPLTLLVVRLWGIARCDALSAGALAALLVTVYSFNPAALLIPTLAMGRGLLLLILCGGIIRLVLRRRSSPRLILALCIAAVTVPLIYVVNDLWLNLGTQWYDLHPQLLALLLTPLALGGILAHSRAERYLPWGAALAVLSVCSFGFWNLWAELVARPFDFAVYLEAAQRQGLPLYQLDQLILAPFSGVYKYHPIFLAFILPLAGFPLELAALLWKALNLAAIMLAGLIMLRIYRQHSRVLGILLAIVLLNLSPISQSLRLGQIDGLLLLGVVFVVAISGKRRSWLAGLLWGVMSVIKIYPAALGLPDLLRYRWRMLLTGGVAVAGTVLLSGMLMGWSNERTFWQEVLPTLGGRTTRLSNQSLYGLIGRTLVPASIERGDRPTVLPLVTVLHGLLAALVVGVTGWLIWRQQHRRDDAETRMITLSTMICAVLLSIPVSWDHYQTLLLLPLVAACAIALRHATRLPWLLGAYTLLAFGTYKQVQNGLIASDVVLFLASYRTIGLLLLWAWWVARLRDEARPDGSLVL